MLPGTQQQQITTNLSKDGAECRVTIKVADGLGLL